MSRWRPMLRVTRADVLSGLAVLAWLFAALAIGRAIGRLIVSAAAR